MQITPYNVYLYTQNNGTIYFAASNGVMIGTVVENVNNKNERDSYLIVGTSMAIPINEHPHNNTQFSRGYYSTREEAVADFRFQLEHQLKMANSSTLRDNPIPTDSLDDFASAMRDLGVVDGFALDRAIRIYRKQEEL